MPDATSTFHLPDDFECFDRKSLKHCVFAALTDDLSFHHQIKAALTDAGFTVTRVEKHWFHDCWEVRLQRGVAMLEDTNVQIRRRIRRVLRARKIYSKYNGLEVGNFGRHLVLGFCSKLGAVGFI